MAIRPGLMVHGRQHGMSLVEQIMVLVIVAVLTGMAVPPLHHLLSRNQLQVAQMDFMSALQHARQTAITTGRYTLFCPTVDGGRCSDDMRWDGGWLLGHDNDGDHQLDHAPLLTGHGYAGKVTVQSSSRRHYVRFSPNGSAGGSNITLLFCLRGNPEHALSVVVSNTGRIRGAPASASQAATCAESS